MTNERNDALLQAQFRAVQASAQSRELQDEANPVSQVLTSLMRHGGLYSLADPEMMAARMAPLMMAQRSTTGAAFVTADQLTPKDVASFVGAVSSTAASFFQHLVTSPTSTNLAYAVPSSLMSHIAFPTTGVAFKNKGEPPSPDIPAAFTFVGQFVDHDLTMNAVNLFEDQTGIVQNTASPLIDLDSVYGPRTKLASPSSAIYNSDGSFKLKKHSTYYDLRRDTQGSGSIADMRNDENQLILQVHLLVMRVHNKFIADGMTLEQAYKETLFNWQSVLLHDYLTRILEDDTRNFLLGEIAKPDFGQFKYKPTRDLVDDRLIASLPHEFAIGFRFGHTQLRSKYQLRPSGPLIDLFNNSLTSAAGPHVNSFADLRGSQKLVDDHVIDWHHFAGNGFMSGAIDGNVTPVVADLPESAIPDDIKYVGNLVHRNLIRSRQVGLCAGEDLADFYGLPRVAHDVIEPDHSAHRLFKQSGKFRTPLWFYLLKEAEHAGTATSSRLGKLGSRLVGEVLLGAIKWAPESVLKEPSWKSAINGKYNVTLIDLADFATFP